MGGSRNSIVTTVTVLFLTQLACYINAGHNRQVIYFLTFVQPGRKKNTESSEKVCFTSLDHKFFVNWVNSYELIIIKPSHSDILQWYFFGWWGREKAHLQVQIHVVEKADLQQQQLTSDKIRREIQRHKEVFRYTQLWERIRSSTITFKIAKRYTNGCRVASK